MNHAPGKAISPTPRYYKVLGRAEEIARAAGSPDVKAEHMLLAIIREPDSVPAQVLAARMDLDEAETSLLSSMSSDYAVYGAPGSRPRNGKVGNSVWGFEAAQALGHSFVGVEHVFVEIVQDGGGTAVQALSRSADPGQLESDVRAIMNSADYLQ